MFEYIESNYHTDSGQAFVWGSGASGQLGLENYESQGTPQQVFLEKNYRRSRGEASESVIDISCGSEHTAVVTSKNFLLCSL